MGRTISRRQFLRAGVVLGSAVAAGPLLQACSHATKQLNFLNWQSYIDPATLTQFEAQSGIAVSYETYASNDALNQQLILANAARRGGRGVRTFDLVVPSDNFVRKFRLQDLLEPLDHSRLTNLGNLRPEFRAEGFDPNNRYTIPWATGTTGIGYDKTVVKSPPDWTIFLDRRFKGRMTLLTEIRDAFAAALFSLGKDPNTTQLADISAAADQLIKMKAVIAGFNSTTYLDDLATGRIVVAQAYSSDLLEARPRNPRLEYVIPAAGGGRWVDSLAKPIRAPNQSNAETFMNFYLRPEISAQVANFVKVDTGNAKAAGLLDPAVRDDPVVYPPAEVFSRLRFTQYLGEAEKLYEEAWRRVQAAPA